MTAPTTAGGGAARRAEVLERRLVEQRALLAQTQQQIGQLEGQLRAWRAGAEGEQRVAAVLDDLDGEGWIVLHDVHWPGRQQANLDHVAIGPGGVVVVDAKNWTWQADVRDGVLRTGRYRKDAECEAAVRMAADVAVLLDAHHRSAVRSALCLVGPAASTGTAQLGVEVVAVDRLAPWLRGLPAVLGPEDVQLLAAHLAQQLTGSCSPALVPPRARAAGAARAFQPTRQPHPTRPVAPGRRRARALVLLVGAAVLVPAGCSALQSLG